MIAFDDGTPYPGSIVSRESIADMAGMKCILKMAEEIDWKQGAGIQKGDTVFMYVGAPVSAILYQCRVTETDIPYEYQDKKLTITALMKIRLEKRYPQDRFTFERLKKEFGIYAVRGPRGIPGSLLQALQDEG